MASSDLCSICDKALYIGNQRISTMKSKGLKTFIEKSRTRDDAKWLQWIDQDSVLVHEDCRLRYKRTNYYPQGEEPSTSRHEDSLIDEDSPENFDFAKLCFLCGEEWNFKNSKKVSYEYMTERFRTTAQLREDEWGESVMNNLSNVRSLLLVKARYHINCYAAFMAPISKNTAPAKKKMDETLDNIYNYIENNYQEKSPFSWKDLKLIIGDKSVHRQTVYKKLKEKYGADIYISEGVGTPAKIFYKNFDDKMIKFDWVYNSKSLTPSQKNLLLDTVADILREDILNTQHDNESYQSPNEFLDDIHSEIPPSLMRFLNKLLPTGKNANSEEKINFVKRDAIAHSIISTINPVSFISHLQLAVGTYIYNKTGSKLIIDLLSKLGVCSTYYQLQLLEASFIMNAGEPNVGDSYVQFVFDNTDHNVATLDGNNTFHNLGGIAVYTPESEVSMSEKCEKLNTMPTSSALASKCNIETKPYSDMSLDAMKNIIFEDVSTLFPNRYEKLPNHYAVYLWAHTMANRKFPVWRGFMEILTQNYSYEISKIICLPFITLPPSKPTTINTALHYSIQQSKKLGQKTCFVTFDQPLYIKAREIVASQPDEMNNVIVRLGGFHMLMSFLGSIGHIMQGSGLEELWSLVYAQQSVPKMLSGHAFSRSLRAHILTFTVLGGEICELINDEEKKEYDTFLAEFLNDLKNTPPDVGDCKNNHIIKELTQSLLNRMDTLKGNGPTAQLWLQYLQMLIIMLQFIEAERTGNWQLHLESVRKMIPFFHASGHFQYAKSSHIYLQDMAKLKTVLDAKEYDEFVTRGFFTIRKSDKAWSGVWSDMTIEQTLNRFFSKDLTHGRGVTASVVARYLLCMPSTYHILNKIENYCDFNSISSEQHIDSMKSRMEKDHADIIEMKKWLKEYTPFALKPSLSSLTSGIMGGNNITCHQAEEIGAKSLQSITGVSASMVTLKRAFIVKNLDHARNGIHIDLKYTSIDAGLLFQRICVLCKNDDTMLLKCFNYELAPVPLSLFDNTGFMRKTKKSDLYSIFQETPSSLSFLRTCKFVVDGGFLLHHVVWPTSQTFQQIMDLYVAHIINHYTSDATIVFDGYHNEFIGVKSYERYRRKEINVTATFNITPNTVVSTSQKKFLSNVCNKHRFVKMLAQYLLNKNIKVEEAPEDADVLIIQTAMKVRETTGKNVVVVGNDVDLLVLLTGLTPSTEAMYFYKINTGKKKNSLYSTQSNKDLKEFILFLHAFSGCDTTSSFFGKGKKIILKMFMKDVEVQQLCRVFYNETIAEKDIYDVAKKITYKLYGEANVNVPINEFRYKKFKCLISQSTNEARLANLPPTLPALQQHAKRVYYQVQRWLGKNIDAENWGWKRMQAIIMVPIVNTEQPAPEEVLAKISCSCSGKCEDKRCSCKKSGLRCNEFCTNCLGISCNNATANIRVQNETPEEGINEEYIACENENNNDYSESSDSENEDNF